MAEAEHKPMTSEARMITPRPATTAATMTPKEILMIFRRHWLMITFMTIIGFGCGIVSWFLCKRYLPEFTAQTFIRVLPPVEKDPTTIQTPIVAKEIQYGHRVSMAMQLKSQRMLQELIDRDKIQETKWFSSFGDIKDIRIRKAVKELQKKFGASPQRDGDSITVSMTCGDKAESALIVNEMARLFVSSQGGEKRKDVAEKLARLEEQQIRIQRDLDQAERNIDDVKRRYGFSDLEEHAFQSVTDRKLSDLEFQENEVLMDISEIRAIINTLAMQAQGPIQVQVERQVETDPVMLSLAQQLALRESSLSSALARFGEDHRIVKQTREYIDSIQAERLQRKEAIGEQTRQSNLRNAQDQLVALERRYDELERMREETAKRKEELDLARAQYQQRVKIRDERRVMLDSIKEQIEKLKIIYDDPETPKVQFAGLAPEPLEASFPKWQIFLPAGFVLGAMAGFGLAFLIEMLNDLVRTPKDVTMYLHIGLLGVIPDAQEDDYIGDIEPALISREAPNSIIGESFRRLRTNVKLSVPQDKAKTLLITSGGAGDGKTTVAVNLATTLVVDGKKVLLIDANLRRPGLSRIFTAPSGIEGKPAPTNATGLSALLAGHCDLQDAIRPSGTERLEIIESGQMPANPAETLGGETMARLIKQQRENYDCVIIDGPPVLLVSETKILSKCVDGTILVFNAASTTRGAALRTIRELRQANAEIFGCVLLGVKTLKGGYFRELFRSYQDYQALEPAKA
ncbi:MAG: polysaccharide biosynthesis tyrosine autokinase [Sedimentisphaerales bacterium]|nr:polysaccharide biosynthesis tyrosine autokinase [Sedimentisphaerales bacterium]